MALILLTATMFISGTVSQIVYADQYDQKINSLRQQNQQTDAADSRLEVQEKDLKAVIARLQRDIDAAESQIKATTAKRAETLEKIEKAEAELQQQRDLLGQNIRSSYLESGMSTLEMLAASKDLSEFVDKQQYRDSVQNKIKTTLDKINKLKQELSDQRKSLEKIIADQKAIQSRLAAKQSERAKLLAMNKSQQAAYEKDIQANNSQIAELRRQQIAANAQFTQGARTNIPDTTGYPWAGAPFPNSISDPWGMYQRQCVSYTAWKVYKSGRYMPYWGGRGNANQWDDNARAAGIPVSSSPKVGDVAVSNSGYYGHVMYVEAVYGDGTIYISQYNAGWDGSYSEARISASGLVFIHF